MGWRRSRRRPTPKRVSGPRVRKPRSSSPTRSLGQELSKPSASPSLAERPPPATGDSGWLILDRFVHCCTRRNGVFAGDATASSLAEESAGRAIRVFLRIADPPAVSRLYLHWRGRSQIEDCNDPAAIAAHRHSILFQITVPFEDPMYWHDTPSFPIDYMVYSCSSSPPSVTLLPPCFDGGHPDPDFPPLRRQHQRIMFNEEMGILCHGDKGEFTVADLTHHFPQDVELCLLHHPPPAGVPLEWSVYKLQIPPYMKINLKTWWTDVVIPIDGTRLCWVDYYQGMLLVDVLTDSPDQQQLQFIQLPPKALKTRRLYRDAGSHDPFRCVCVTDAGIIKLVCIRTTHPPSDQVFYIKTWTLVDINQGSWKMDVNSTMSADDFFGLYNTAHGHLPWVRPSFPVVSLVDPDVICFLLKEEGCNLVWMVEVNMRKKVLQSSAIYINEEEEGHSPRKGRLNGFHGHYFIPSKFSSYLSEDAITSRELSQKMQEAKERKVTQKGGLEA